MSGPEDTCTLEKRDAAGFMGRRPKPSCRPNVPVLLLPPPVQQMTDLRALAMPPRGSELKYECIIHFPTHHLNARANAHHGHPPGTLQTTVDAIRLQLAVKELQLVESNTS